MRFYTTSRLSGTRLKRHAYLAAAQQTMYAVTSIHTPAEFELFRKAVSPGGTFSDRGNPSKPIKFADMARWWSGFVNGETIFYKLPEVLEAHYKKRIEKTTEITSLALSEQARSRNHVRITSKAHAATVLPPSSPLKPGIPLTKASVDAPETMARKPNDDNGLPMTPSIAAHSTSPEQPPHTMLPPLSEAQLTSPPSPAPPSASIAPPRLPPPHSLPLQAHTAASLTPTRLLPVTTSLTLSAQSGFIPPIVPSTSLGSLQSFSFPPFSPLPTHFTV